MSMFSMCYHDLLTWYTFNSWVAFVTGGTHALWLVSVDRTESSDTARFVGYAWVDAALLSAHLVVVAIIIGIAFSNGNYRCFGYCKKNKIINMTVSTCKSHTLDVQELSLSYVL